METAVTPVGNTLVPVRADGQPIEKKDADTWTLHILPRLYIPGSDIGGDMPCEAVQLTECTLTVGDKTISVLPSEVAVRCPYPNGDYYAAGTPERKLGWNVNIPAELTHCQLIQRWVIGVNYPQTDLFPCFIQYSINLELVATEQGHVFSLDQTNYFYDPNARGMVSDRPSGIGGVLPEHINDYHFLKGNQGYAIRREGRIVFIEQKIKLTSCAWSDLILLESIERLKLCRDAAHLSSFTRFNEEHRNNACCEIPASVMFDAVLAAQKIPFGKDTDYPFKDSESHPALKLLARWWNENSPNVEYRRASFCYFWVRVEDDDVYWPGQDECPTNEIVNFAGLKDSIARFGDLIAIEFVQSPRIVDDNYGGIAYIDLVDGREYTNVDADQYEALDALMALERFPGEFPAAWDEICRQTEQEWKSEGERRQASQKSTLEVKSSLPRTDLPRFLAPTSNGDDFKAIQDYQSRSSNEQDSVDDYFDDSPDIDELEYSDRMVESNNLQDEDQRKELLDFVGGMEEHINELPANEKNDYADQLEQIKAAETLPELKDRVNQLSIDLYAKSYDAIQYGIAMMTEIVTSEGVVSKQPENITDQLQELDDTQRTKTPSVPAGQPTQNTFWITHTYSYLHSKLTCVNTTRTHAQARLDAYYILSEGYGAFDENQKLSDVEPMQESVCHLLIKFFGYEICEYDDSAIEIDLYDLWNWTQDDIHPTNKSWDLWLNLSRFRWGFCSELMAVMDGSLNVDTLPQYPWHSQHKSVTGWDCDEYIIEVPFCSFNSESEAEEFGRSCFALQTNEKYPSLFRLLYGDGDQACIRKDDVVVYRKPSMSHKVNPDDRSTWEVTDLSAEDIPDLEISGPLYCQGREIKGGPHHAS